MSKMSGNEEQLCTLEKTVKNYLYAIVAAADRKNGDLIEVIRESCECQLRMQRRCHRKR